MAQKLLTNPPAQWAQRTSHLAEPKCKWGRHCCRPHSHPRVAFIRRTWRPVFRHFRGKPQIRFLHRRSRRHPVLSGSVSSPKTVFFPFQFRDRSFHVGQVPSGSALAEAPAFPSLPGRSVRPVSAILSRSDHWTAQRLVETFCEASYWTAWTVAKTSVRVKISSDIKSLDRQSEKVFRLSDDLRLRFKAESGKQVIH